jgi:predicted transcriptional regulator
MDHEALLTHVADIVSAHVSNNSVAQGDVSELIGSVYAALAALGQTPEPLEEKRVPAVSIRSSIKNDAIACLECGGKMKMLKRHLGTDHQLTPAEYRARWGLAADYPMVAPDYAERRKELAIRIGLGRKPRQAPPPPAKPARSRKKLGVAFSGNGDGDA